MAEPYLVRFCGNDEKTHAFDPDQEGKDVWRAKCGHSVAAVKVNATTQRTPSCIPCLVEVGTPETDHLHDAEARTAKSGRHDNDVRAMITAGRLRGLLDKAAHLDGPTKHHALRALCAHSPDIRRWTRWAATATAAFPTAPMVVGFSLHALATGTGFLLPLIGIVVGAAALVVLAVGLWGVGQQAMDLAVGTYVDCTPPPVSPGDIA